MKAALLIDFGSTYTKLRAVDVERATILGAGQGPSTVGTDITIGMRAALADLERHIGVLPPFAYRLACSSAAGGLRMVTVGLVRELTAEAARQAALGAGARLVGTFAYRLTAADVTASSSWRRTSCCWPAAPTAATARSSCTMPTRSAEAGLPARSCWRATGARWINAANGLPAGR